MLDKLPSELVSIVVESLDVLSCRRLETTCKYLQNCVYNDHEMIVKRTPLAKGEEFLITRIKELQTQKGLWSTHWKKWGVRRRMLSAAKEIPYRSSRHHVEHLHKMSTMSRANRLTPYVLRRIPKETVRAWFECVMDDKAILHKYDMVLTIMYQGYKPMVLEDMCEDYPQ